MGEDLDGNIYTSAEELWRVQLGTDEREKDRWYSKAIDYWEKKDASVDGVLDGFKCLSSVDLRASLDFLDQIADFLKSRSQKGGSAANTVQNSQQLDGERPLGLECGDHGLNLGEGNESRKRPQWGKKGSCGSLSGAEYHRIRWKYVLDCGAGIGRVTKGCLLKRFLQVDIVEPIWKFVQKAKKSLMSETILLPEPESCTLLAADSDANETTLSGDSQLSQRKPLPSEGRSKTLAPNNCRQRIRRVPAFFCSSLQDFKLPRKRYNCVWVQWCALYLTDNDLVAFLERCKNEALVPGGFVCVKENVVPDRSGFVMDTNDNSIMRSDEHYLELFASAGFEVVLRKWQPHFPSSLYPVRLYCLLPKETDTTSSVTE